MSKRVKAITFDLWDTVIDDASDEPKRKASGLPSKSDARFNLLVQAMRQYNAVTEEELQLGVRVVDQAFLRCWKDYSITWTYPTRLQILLKGLNLSLPESEVRRLAKRVGHMELEIPPEPIDGIEAALKELSSRYNLCIVSDTIFTPGARLRDLLELYGLNQYFSGYAFSDEVGRSKPHKEMFLSAARQMGCGVSEMIHIGDRDHNDIKGAQALGMKSILFVGKRKFDKESTSADFVCEHHSELPMLIEKLVSEKLREKIGQSENSGH